MEQGSPTDVIEQCRRMETHLRVLSDAGRLFAAQITAPQRLLETVAQQVALVVRDFCLVLLLGPDEDTLTLAGAYDPEPQIRERLRAAFIEPFLLASHPVSRRALETGEPLFTPRLDLEQLRPPGTTPQFFELFQDLQVHSLMVVPLRVQGRSLGQLTLARFRPEAPPFDAHDLALARNLADHAALAVNNGRLLAEEAAASLLNARSFLVEREARNVAELATAALRKSEARINRLSESGLIGIVVSDLSGRIIEANDTLLRMVGHSREEIMSGAMPWKELTPPEWREVDATAIRELLESGVGNLREKEFLHRDGQRVPVLLGTALLDKESQECISFVLDLTERRAAEKAIERLQARHADDARFRGLLESAPDAMVIADEAGRIELVNAQAEALFGYARAEMIGQPVELLIPHRFNKAHAAHRAGYFRKPERRAMRAGLELFGRRKDGSEFPAEISLSPLVTDAGTLVSSAIRDLSERKKSERQNARLAAIVDSSDDAIISKTLEGVVTSWNPGAERLFGYSAEEMIGQPIAILLPPERAQEEPTILASAAKGEVKRFESVRRCKDGSEIEVAVTISPIRDGSGRVVGISKVARAITEQKRAERQLARARDAAEAASRELEAFSYSVAHDLRAPLRGMSGFSQILLDDHGEKLGADGRDFLLEIQANAQKMGSLIDALLGLSRVSRNECRPKRINLSALVRAAATEIRAAEPSRPLELVIEEEVWVSADPALLRVLLDNLLGNAWKFTARAGCARIEFGASKKNGSRELFLRDNGAGFEMAHAAKLFAPFQRLHTQAEFPGTGIGLATVQRIVHRHGGRIRAEGKAGEGAVFYFTLPDEPALAAAGASP